MIADSAARLRALDVTQSFIVQAPAGSGKTELLIQRYLKLLETVDSPDAVVAITFTRKAAGEMRSRVVQALWAARRGAEPEAEHERLTYQISRRVLEHARQRGWDLLRNPARLRIETTDALCAAITRRMPWLSRFGAMPEISERAEDLYREAARNTLGHLNQEHRVNEGDHLGHAGLAYLLLHLDNDFQRARSLISQMLERRDQWLRHTGGNVRPELEAAFEQLILEELQELRAACTPDIAAEFAALLDLERFPEARLEDAEAWRRAAELVLTKDGKLRKRVSHPLKARCESLLARLQNEGLLIERLARFRELPGARFSESQWQAIDAAVSVLKLAVAELQLVFRERGRVDFAELSIRASAALGEVDAPEDLALALGAGIRHLLVDEFQDSSATQFELLEKLTSGWEPADGRTLFLVGDPMQSIYRFREADVSLFLKAREQGIGAIRLEPLTLSVNFRSRPEIVGWVNKTFGAVFPDRDDPEWGAVAYSPSVANSKEADATIGVHCVANERDEADRVVELLRGERNGTTAILVRSRGHLIEIVSRLKRDRIPYQAIEIDQLGERQVVEDLMALTFALLHAADRVSWLAILRAPWCGLTLDDLHALAGSDHNAVVWNLLRPPNEGISEDGRAGIARVVTVLEQALAERGRRPLRDWVENTWHRLGGPACVENDTALEDAAAYFDLLEHASEGTDLADFDWFREQVSAFFAQPNAQAGERLQLMTIHKAKGLEFDTVILPALGAVPRGDDARLLLWLEHRGKLLVAPIAESGGDKDPIYSYLAGIERRKSDEETARLLYVAATRARQSLHLLGSAKLKADGTIGDPDSRSFLKLIWRQVSGQFAAPAPANQEQLSPARRQALRRLAPNWRVPQPGAPVTWRRRGIERVTASETSSYTASGRSRYAGAALHEFLHRIAREGLDRWDEGAVRSHREAYRAVLANLGVPPDDLAWAAERVEAALLGIVRDPRGIWILSDHGDARNEYSIAGLIGGQLCEAVIDRTFLDENGVRWIIDYKTSTHEGAGLENFLEQEKNRYREQLERYARLMALLEDRPIRLGIYFPLLGQWLEWSAPVPLRKQALLFEL